MQTLEPYYRRVWRLFWKDATPWARDNIFWALMAFVVPPLAAYLHANHAIDKELLATTLWFYFVTSLLYAVIQVCRVPKKLDRERDLREKSLSHEITAKEQIIHERDGTIIALREKPKRSLAEEHDYDKAKKALDRFGKKAAIALRHLRLHGSLIFGTFNPILPDGLTRDDSIWAYNACAGEGLVTRADNSPKYGEATFAISPKMSTILDELLYDSSILDG